MDEDRIDGSPASDQELAVSGERRNNEAAPLARGEDAAAKDRLELELKLEEAKRKAAEEQRKAAEEQKQADAERRKADEASARSERERRKTARSERRSNRARSFIRLPISLKIGIALGVLAVIALTIIGGSFLHNFLQPNEILTSSQLAKMVNVSRLSTAEFIYNGIAEQVDDEGNVRCHIYYEAKIGAGVDMSQIQFEIDQENRIVYPIIPEIEIEEPEIDEASIEFFERNPNISTQDVMRVCKEDAQSEAEETGQIYETALINMRSAVEALTNPLVESYGYSIEWERPATDSAEQQNGSEAIGNAE